jgi:hypothetical protein
MLLLVSQSREAWKAMGLPMSRKAGSEPRKMIFATSIAKSNVRGVKHIEIHSTYTQQDHLNINHQKGRHDVLKAFYADVLGCAIDPRKVYMHVSYVFVYMYVCIYLCMYRTCMYAKGHSYMHNIHA